MTYNKAIKIIGLLGLKHQFTDEQVEALLFAIGCIERVRDEN